MWRDVCWKNCAMLFMIPKVKVNSIYSMEHMAFNIRLQEEKGEEYWAEWDTYLMKSLTTETIINAIVKHGSECK